MSLSGRYDFLATGNTVQQATNRANVEGVILTNDSTGLMVMQIFDSLASDVTLGSTVANMVLSLASGVLVTDQWDFHGASFANGFAYAITTTSTGTVALPQGWVTVVYV